MEKNLFIYIDWLPVVHVASRFSEKMSQKEVVSKKKKKRKKERENDARNSGTRMEWYLRFRSRHFLIQKFHVLSIST